MDTEKKFIDLTGRPKPFVSLNKPLAHHLIREVALTVWQASTQDLKFCLRPPPPFSMPKKVAPPP